LRRLLEKLGPTFIKLGQFLALRPDIIPQEYCDELMSLFEHAAPFPWEDARRILAEELKEEPEVTFRSIDPVPLAAGSLAQTHFARLHDGTEVAVKILRPGIAERIEQDLSRTRIFARVLELTGFHHVISPTELVEELRIWLMQEIDLDRELANMSRLHRAARESEVERIPRPFPDYSTSRVLTAEYIHGITFAELIAAARPDPKAPLRRRRRFHVDRDQLASNLLRACLGQIFRYRFFHADVHPGNLVALSDDAIGFVDFGLCDSLDETVRAQQMRYLSAVYNRDVEAMFRAISELLIPSTTTDMEAFRADFHAETRNYLSRIDDPEESRRTGGSSPIADWLVAVVRSARRHDLRFPPKILSMYRTLLTAESVARILSPGNSLRLVGREFFRELQYEEIARSFTSERIEPVLLSLFTLGRDWPVQLQQILADLTAGRLSMTMRTAETPHTRRLRDLRTKLLAAAILTVSSAMLLNIPALPAFLRGNLIWIVAAFHTILLGIVVRQWRRLR